jgi:hypothetical protein
MYSDPYANLQVQRIRILTRKISDDIKVRCQTGMPLVIGVTELHP